MNYIEYFLTPVLSVLTILYLIFYFKNRNRIVIKKDDKLIDSKYYSIQEIISSQKRYIQIYLSEKLPNYSEYTKEAFFKLFKLKRKDCFEGINYFLSLFKREYSENTHFLILGSAGIGKTTFLLNLYAKSIEKIVNININIIPLRCNNIDKELESIKTIRKDTILLLDGFDEIPNQNKETLKKIIEITKGFKYVLISSRLELFKDLNTTQFQTSVIKYSGNKENYPIKKMYVSPFSKRDVKQYLKYSFKENKISYRLAFFFFGNPNVSEALSLLDRVKFASLRPLFLYYISDLVKGEYDTYNYDFEVYDELVSKWIHRESYDIEDKINFEKNIFQTFTQIAINLKNSENGYLSFEDINTISSYNSSHIDRMILKSKSLLTRNKHNQYYFFHNSILEYFLAKNFLKTIIDSKESIDFNKMKMTTLSDYFIKEMLIKYFLNDSSFVIANVSNIDNELIVSPIERIKSINDAIKIKYLCVENSETPLHYISLMPNIVHLRYKKMLKEDLQYLSYLKNLTKIDISGNKEIKDLSELKYLNSLKELVLVNSIGDITTLLGSNIKSIIIAKDQYSSEIINKFPKDVIRVSSFLIHNNDR